jgi:HAD superfamily hydrolase (TIGR01509 family)
MHIRNIVFDLGNVLISYNPEDFHLKKGDSAEDTELFISDVYRSPEWQLIDKGEMTVEEAILSIATRSTLTAPEIARIFKLREELLFAIDQNTSLLKRLKKARFGLYYISNFPHDMFDVLSKKYDFFRFFDGGIYSASVKVLKPDPEIYRRLIKDYQLNASESLFIDDLQKNIDSAGREGFLTLHLTQAEKLEQELRALLPEAFVNN